MFWDKQNQRQETATVKEGDIEILILHVVNDDIVVSFIDSISVTTY